MTTMVQKKIREDPKTKDIKIMFLTVSRVSDNSMFKLSKYNIEDYITKPFEIVDVVKRVKEIVK